MLWRSNNCVALFHGEGNLTFPSRGCVAGVWDNGEMKKCDYIFDDALEYSEKNWDYCSTDKDRRFWSEIQNEVPFKDCTSVTNNGCVPLIPNDCFDVGDGYYDPKEDMVYSYNDDFLRSITDEEAVWAKEKCRIGKVGDREINPDDIATPRPSSPIDESDEQKIVKIQSLQRKRMAKKEVADRRGNAKDIPNYEETDIEKVGEKTEKGETVDECQKKDFEDTLSRFQDEGDEDKIVKIQSQTRKKIAVKKVEKRKEEKQLKKLADSMTEKDTEKIIKIQSLQRCHTAKKEVEEMRKENETETEEKGAEEDDEKPEDAKPSDEKPEEEVIPAEETPADENLTEEKPEEEEEVTPVEEKQKEEEEVILVEEKPEEEEVIPVEEKPEEEVKPVEDKPEEEEVVPVEEKPEEEEEVTPVEEK
eukprot:159371_1